MEDKRPIKRAPKEENKTQVVSVDNHKLTRQEISRLDFPPVRRISDFSDVSYSKTKVAPQHLENIKVIFPLSDCQAMRRTIESKNNKFVSLQVFHKSYGLADVCNMITSHKMITVKEQVQEEDRWFQENLQQPINNCDPPEITSLEQFQDLLLQQPNDKVLYKPSTTTEDLSFLCCSRWMSLQSIDPFVDLLNDLSATRKVLQHGNFINHSSKVIHQKLSATGHFKQPLECLLIILNVGKDSEQRTVVSSNNITGNHWSMLEINIRNGKYTYLDSLGWSPPVNLCSSIKNIIQAVSHLQGKSIAGPTKVDRAHRAICERSRNACSDECIRNYPLQQCSQICGTVPIMMAAVCIGAPKVWDAFYRKNSGNRCLEWLKNPTAHASYIRKVLIAWYAKKEINLKNLGIMAEDRQKKNEDNNVSSEKIQTDITSPAKTSLGSVSREKRKPIVIELLDSEPDTEDLLGEDEKSTVGLATDETAATNKYIKEIDQEKGNATMKEKTTAENKDILFDFLCSAYDKNGTANVERSMYDIQEIEEEYDWFLDSTELEDALKLKPRKDSSKRTHGDVQSNEVQKKRTRVEMNEMPDSKYETRQKVQVGETKSSKKNTKERKCEYCDMTLSSAHTLYKHKKRKHQKEMSTDDDFKSNQLNSIKCTECNNFSCGTRLDLIDHYNNVHGRGYKKEDREFENWQDFISWKKTLEKEDRAWFVTCRGKRLARAFETSWFVCNREGTPRLNGTGKRALKKQGTSKIGGHCTSYMKVKKYFDSGRVGVEFCLDHTGHEKQLGHLRIADDIRKRIAGKLSKGVSLDKILDEIRENSEGRINREHVIERQDIWNIKYQHNIELMERHKNDTFSVHCWIQELRKSNYDPVLVYKPQGVTEFSLPESDFLVGIQTKYQLDMLKAHGGKVICMDATHSTNQYDFMLTTVMVIDEYGEGCPVAWLISNREDQLVLNPFIAAIKERVGEMKTEIFMSDDANNFYNAWISHFAKPASKLICSWHVDKNWRKNLRKHISTQQEQAEVYKTLKTLQMELDEAKFRREAQEFSSWCEKRYPEFNDYFVEYYLRHPEQWATCFRIGKGINTNMVTEAFHNVLKGVYFQRRQNKRVDHLLCILLKIARDKVCDALIKDQKGKRTYKHRETDKRHKKALEIDQKQIIEIGAEESWTVQSQMNDNICYTVRKNQSVCTCKVKCTFCKVCQHNYTCSCTDFAVRALACKHIHAVQIHRGEELSLLSAVSKEDTREPGISDIDYLETMMKQDTKYIEGQGALEDLRNKIFQKIEDLHSIVGSTRSLSALKGCFQHLNSTITVTEGLSIIEDEQSYFEVKKRCPPNKKFEIQPRFEKTKKKAKKPPKLIVKPTNDERQKIQKKLAKQTPTICGFCFKEDDCTGNDDNSWVQCPRCGLWAHLQCENVEDTNGYVCSICRKS